MRIATDLQPGDQETGSINVSGTVIAGNFQGDGSSLTNVDAISLNGQSASYYTDAANISSGKLSDSRLNSDVAFQNGNNTFSSSNTFSGDVLAKSTGDSATAFQVQQSGGTVLLTVDDSTGQVVFNNATTSATAILIGTASKLYEVTPNVLETNAGLLPSMTSTERDALTSPPTGTMIYNTTTAEYEYNSGTGASPNWVPFNRIKTYTWATLPISAARNSYALVEDTLGDATVSILFQYRDDLDATYPWVPVGSPTMVTNHVVSHSSDVNGWWATIGPTPIKAAGVWEFDLNTFTTAGTWTGYIGTSNETGNIWTGSVGNGTHVDSSTIGAYTITNASDYIWLSAYGHANSWMEMILHYWPVKIAGNS